MEVINGKVWITNVNSEITDISQLDLHNNFWGELTEAGAKFELGAGNPPEYGPGVYCTNLSKEQIIQIYADNFKKKHGVSATNEGLSIVVDAQETKTDEPEDTVENIYGKIRRISRSYNLAVFHGMMGFNTGDIIEKMEDTYQNEVVPLINELSSEDKSRLIEKLEELLSFDRNVDTKSIQNAIEYITSSMGKGK